MSAAGDKVLVVGGDGFVARALIARWTKRVPGRVTVTTRRRDLAGPHRPLLDLASGDGFEIAERGFGTAILCAARARLADCRADPSGTRLVNVTGTSELAQRLAAAGTRVILLSTDKVFDGSRPHRPASDAPCPTSVYGRQKAAAESAVLALPGGAVLRLSKVVGPGAGPFQGWMETWRTGGTVHPFADFPLAPVPVSLVADVLGRMIDRSASGIFQLTAATDIDYARAASHLARRLGIGANRVQPVTGRMGEVLGGEPPSAFTSLDGGRLRDLLGMEPPDPFDALESVLTPSP